MSIIRDEAVQETLLLTQNGELLDSKEEEFVDVVEEECRKAFQKGQEKGEKIGYQQALEESKLYLNLLQTMTQKVLDQKNRLLDQLKPEVIEFSMAVCERVIRQELSHPDALVSLINSLLTSVTTSFNEESLLIVLSEDDFLMLEKSFDHIHHEKREIEGVRFISDPLIRRGDCRIETKSGLLNYAIARELKELQAKVLQR